MSWYFDVLDTFSVHPASPALLTSNGPQKTQAIRPASPQSFPRVTGTYRRRGTPEQKRLGEVVNRLYSSCGDYSLGHHQSADNTTLRRWQFEDRPRDMVPGSALFIARRWESSAWNPFTTTFLPPEEEVRIALFNHSMAVGFQLS